MISSWCAGLMAKDLARANSKAISGGLTGAAWFNSFWRIACSSISAGSTVNARPADFMISYLVRLPEAKTKVLRVLLSGISGVLVFGGLHS